MARLGGRKTTQGQQQTPEKAGSPVVLLSPSREEYFQTEATTPRLNDKEWEINSELQRVRKQTQALEKELRRHEINKPRSDITWNKYIEKYYKQYRQVATKTLGQVLTV